EKGRTLPAQAPREEKAPPSAESESKKLSFDEQVSRYFEKRRYADVVYLINREKASLEEGKPYRRYYAESLAGMKAEAVSLIAQGEYEKAGKLLLNLKAALAGKEDVGKEAGVTAQEVEESIDLCARKLMEGGLAEYREGNLGLAIQKWKKILTFLPDHREAKRAIELATVQMKNLKKLEEEKE
ncbi:MAG: hypothetical protein D6713_00005, partial [Deltaproteobacteria bacterium]